MKRLLTLLLSVFLAVSLVGCNSDKEQGKNKDKEKPRAGDKEQKKQEPKGNK